MFPFAEVSRIDEAPTINNRVTLEFLLAKLLLALRRPGYHDGGGIHLPSLFLWQHRDVEFAWAPDPGFP